MNTNTSKYSIVFGCLLLFLLITLSLGGTALNITFMDTIDYNVTYNATDESESPHDISANPSTYIHYAEGQIKIENMADEDLADVNVTIDNTAQLKQLPVFNAPLSDVGGFVHDDGWTAAAGGPITFHIPDLPLGKEVVFDYIIEEAEIFEPLNITKNVTTPLGNGRIFTNDTFNVTINVSMRMGDASTEITLNAWEYGLNDFTFRNDTGFMDVSEGDNVTIDNSTLCWENVTLYGVNDSAQWNIAVNSPWFMPKGAVDAEGQSYNVRKNYLQLLFGKMLLNFTANDTVWDVDITKVDAKPKGRVTVTKERSGDYAWSIYPRFKNNAVTPQLYYQINRVSVWAVPSQNSAATLDPGNQLYWMNNSYFQWNETSTNPGDMPSIIAPGEEWVNDSSANNGMGYGHTFFNDTHVPIVWGKVNYTLVDNGTTVSRRYYTRNRTGEYVYRQKVMLLQGYFLEAEKFVEDLNGEGMYKVLVYLTNRGNANTPNSTLLADLVPPNMDVTNSTGYTTDDGIEINSTDANKDYTKTGDQNGILWARYSGSQNFTGKQIATGDFANYNTYYWELKMLSPGETIAVTYYVNGTGEYFPGDMYIVGVDPVQANCIAASRGISSSDGLKVPLQTQEEYAVPLSFGILAISLFSIKRRKEER